MGTLWSGELERLGLLRAASLAQGRHGVRQGRGGRVRGPGFCHERTPPGRDLGRCRRTLHRTELPRAQREGRVEEGVESSGGERKGVQKAEVRPRWRERERESYLRVRAALQLLFIMVYL